MAPTEVIRPKFYPSKFYTFKSLHKLYYDPGCMYMYYKHTDHFAPPDHFAPHVMIGTDGCVVY